MEEIKEEIKEMVDQAVQFQRKGDPEKGLELLQEAEEKTKLLPASEAKSLLGLIHHYRGRIFQAMGRYNLAVDELQTAILIRRGDPIGYGYSTFQLLICKDYAGFPISPFEIEATKRALWEMADATKQSKELGDIFQNLAYIEERQGDINKAIWLYQVAEVFRGIANDQRGFAMTWARLGECYRQIGKDKEAREYGEKALKYFEKIGDQERIRQVKENIFGENK